MGLMDRDALEVSSTSHRGRSERAGRRVPSLLGLASVGVAGLLAAVSCGGGPHGLPGTGSGTANGPSRGAPTTTEWPLDFVAWPQVEYPPVMDCAPVGTRLLQVEYATPHAGMRLAFVLVACNAGAGSPPSALFVYDRATSSSSPHLAQTLLTPGDDWLAGRLTVLGSRVSVSVSGYSSKEVARCCPDVSSTLTWSWERDAYHKTGHEVRHV